MTKPPRPVVEAMVAKYGYRSLTDLEKACGTTLQGTGKTDLALSEVFFLANIAVKRFPGIKDDARLVNRWNIAKRREGLK